MRKLPVESLDEIRAAYEGCVSMSDIAADYGCSRQAVHKFLRKHGVETRKTIATRRELRCDLCGEFYEVNRARYREVLKNKRKFCSDVCYHVYLENKDSVTNRHHQRIARSKVSEVFDLKTEHVVHHKDFNHFNTMLDNFMVFANNSDHVKYHHQLRQGEVTVEPVWG